MTPSRPRSSSPGKIALIGCLALEREINALGVSPEHVIRRELMRDSLHEVPALLRQMLVRALAAAEADLQVDSVVLAYGACGMAVSGLAPTRCRLVMPRAHDCVTLLLGSKERYAACMAEDPSLYWYTPGWCRSGRMPGPDREITMRAELQGRLDPEQLESFLAIDRESLAVHSRAAYTDLALPGDEEQHAYASHCTRCLGWKLQRERGDPRLLIDLLSGPWDDDRFLVVEPGEEIAASSDPGRILKAVPRQP